MKIEHRLITKRERFLMRAIVLILLPASLIWLRATNEFINYSFELTKAYDTNKIINIISEGGLGKELKLSIFYICSSLLLFRLSLNKTVINLLSFEVIISITSIILFFVDYYIS